jgi:hypothetical protein
MDFTVSETLFFPPYVQFAQLHMPHTGVLGTTRPGRSGAMGKHGLLLLGPQLSHVWAILTFMAPRGTAITTLRFLCAQIPRQWLTCTS